MYSLALADVIGAFTGAEAAVLGDVTYGACCVDDLSAAALGAGLLVHYGHSCLVPAALTTADSGVRVLYVFVEVAFDTRHLAACVAAAFPPPAPAPAGAGGADGGGADGGAAPPGLAAGGTIALQGTVQFVGALHEVAAALAGSRPDLALSVPQAKPLSPGETLGCTAPRLPPGTRALVFVADGRFHLEAALIANAGVRALRYDPYARSLVAEGYDHARMDGARRAAVAAAAAAPTWGLVLGTLGRQGSAAVLGRVRAAAEAAGKTTLTLLASELRPAALAAVPRDRVGAWVQVCCPRLSIDWGAGFEGAGGAPLLTPYEAFVAAGAAAPWAPREYPMDYYARDAGPWGNYYRG